MKIALITDDGKTISQHFGRAASYLVATTEDGKVIQSELRPKLGHNHFHSMHAETEHHSAEHGKDAESHNKHVSMAETISDCEVLICGGMGMGAYDSMLRLGIKVVVTDVLVIESAIQAYLSGTLKDRMDLLH